ncbi:ABC transporter substrate-binding protein [Cohnella nanjingensis]|uniref:Extracellular solute-binding protein n=1 Tax=Cohnella nanjingensis TaxID=1387779 RepID=A0A7X0RSW4_9BACL|nr:extracellular solute-binding protein [Cohnella nanjingensis]MBB6672980.1 extracellular solute-binding protein [Cohnella nanjingensis]
MGKIKGKKGLALILSAVFMVAVVLSGCSGNKEAASEDSKPAATDSPAKQEATETASASPEEKEATIRITAQVFTPTDEKTPTENTPIPRVALDKIIEDYQKQHPKIKVEIVKAPTSSREEYLTWMTTQIAAGEAPDIAWTSDSLQGFVEKEWLLPLDSYLGQDNPFGDQNVTWIDSFTNPELFRKFPNGSYYSVPIVQAAGSATTFYYNIDIFKQLNLSVPQTWQQLLDALKKAKEAGYIAAIPVVENKGPTLWQMGAQVSIPLTTNLLGDFNYTGAKSAVELKGDEYIRAIKKGIVSMDRPEFREIWRLYKEWAQMWPDGWATQDMMPLWREGKVAVREGGMWELQQELSDTKRQFKWGVFPMPAVGSDSSKYAVDLPKSKGFQKNTSSMFDLGIVKPTVEKKGTTEAAIRFLQYLTTAKVNEYMVNEVPQGLPTVKGAATLPLFDAIKESESPVYPEINIPMNVWINSEARDTIGRNAAMWIQNKLPDDKFFANVEKALTEGADKSIKEQKLDTSKW